ncbi:MAG: hypothetical protein K6F39_03180, partial [Lachnospiraceae bacterium]|nr:hypothetical protein [Lachnospiraceae bacterium]
MKNVKVKYFCRAVVFLAVLVIILVEINRIFMPKFFYENDWATTNTYTGFYKMKKNSIDVLFLGSSHAA